MNPHLQRGLLLFEQSRHEMAEAEFRQALAADPDDAYPHALLGLCLAEREQFEPATDEARQAIHLAPDFSFAHYALARVMCDRRRYVEALTAINEAIRLDSAEANYFAVLGDIHIQESRWREALQAAERGLEQEPEHIACTNLRAMALVKLGRRAEAGATIDAALAKAPENAFTHANQGWTYLEKGDPKKALEHFRESLRLDPTNEWARRGIVEALKARNIIYAAMLKYFLWMAKLSPQVRWGIILGGYFGNQVLRGVAAGNPAIAPWILPLRILYITFALMTWLAYPLFNLLLRLSRYGRYALLPEQVIESNWIGACFLLALCSLGGCIAAGFDSPWFLSMIVFGLLMIPVTCVFRCPIGWPRRTMLLVTLGIALLGLLVIALTWQAELGAAVAARAKMDTVFGLLSMFSIGVLASQFLANYLIGARPKR